MKSHFHGLRDWAFPQQAKKAFLYVQMRCLPISDIYVTRVESYARMGHKRLLMTKRTSKYMEDQEKWEIQNMMISLQITETII